MTVDFYYSPLSGSCNAIIMIAKAIGVDLKLIPVDISKGENLTPEFLKLNPQHTIPTINDNGFSLWESRAILTYLVDKYGKDDALYPRDAQKRALINQRLYFEMGTVNQRFGEYFYPQVRQGKPSVPELWTKALGSIEFLNTFLEGSSFVVGNSATVADYALGMAVAIYLLFGLELNDYSNVQRWYASLSEVLTGWTEAEENVKGLRTLFEQMKQKYSSE